MNIFEILKHLYTAPNPKWILDIDEQDISPFLILRFIATDKNTTKQSRILNNFLYKVPPKMFLSIAWSVLFFNGKKLNKAPFITLIKTKEIKRKYEFIFKKIQVQYLMSDKDLKIVEPFIVQAIDKDIVNWFSYYGATNEQWLLHNLDIDLLKTYGDKRPEIKKGLDAWL